MLIQCDICGRFYDSGEEKCPGCGSINKEMSDNPKIVNDSLNNSQDYNSESISSTEKILEPKTIEELKSWYYQEQLPPQDTTRFFIGFNIQEPKAFGIYKSQDGSFIVYKNKADGTRAIRYQGPDEAFAVNEFWLRLKEEIRNQRFNILGSNKNHGFKVVGDETGINRSINDFKDDLRSDFGSLKSDFTQTTSSMRSRTLINNPKRALGYGIGLFTAIVIFFSVWFVFPKDGYYLYNNKYYYRFDGSWYKYNSYWAKTYDIEEELKQNHKNYYLSSKYNVPRGVSDFRNSSAYREYERQQEYERERSRWYDSDRSTSWDSGSSSSSFWDSDSSSSSWSSWDSDSTDWDSDW